MGCVQSLSSFCGRPFGISVEGRASLSVKVLKTFIVMDCYSFEVFSIQCLQTWVDPFSRRSKVSGKIGYRATGVSSENNHKEGSP